MDLNLIFLEGLYETSDKEVRMELLSSKEKQVAGKRLYGQYCTSCHGKEGNLELSGAKDLRESTLSEKETGQIISQGKSMMPAYKERLTPQEIQVIVAYLPQLRGNQEKK